MSYPATVPSYVTADPNKTLAADNHTARHNQEEADIIALGTKLGTGGSTASSGTVLRGTGAGSTAYGQINASTDIGTFASSVLIGLLTDETGTGANVFGTSPTLTTPMIADFTNAQHNHTNAAGGGKITSSAITSFNTSLTTISNPYKFSAYRSTAFTAPGLSALVLDAKLYDTNSNFNITTGRYVAPVNGFYHFSGQMCCTLTPGAGFGVGLGKNGAVVKKGYLGVSGASTFDGQAPVSADIQLVAGDYVELFVYTSGQTGVTGSVATYLDGFLTSQS